MKDLLAREYHFFQFKGRRKEKLLEQKAQK
jgi:hypothetical protein